MIGSGFSRNARKNRPDAEDLPTWRELGRAIHSKLYQQQHGGDRADHIVQTPGTDNILRLAQEYEAAFGRQDLNRFLRELIRDEDYSPVDTHLRLLRLPWRDVFTTNWDTLLERASYSVAECNYSVVRTMNEIPLAFKQRIVKLHGSFPDYFPLIITEEDYRTYPAKFAPFVNTVQQAMMETVFCLIGFSGDDPNFLRWSGWVRDNLGDAAPKIYLAGWLELSTFRRRMLEDHNVVPIDLARHPQANEWQDHQRHHYAIEWILYTLERGQPYEVVDWPSMRKWQHESIPDHLEPIVKLEVNEPKSEALTLPTEESQDPSGLVRKILDAWRHNRRLYPGWLSAPAGARHIMSSNTESWEPYILGETDFAPVQRLYAIRELVWRREILLEPISSELESAAEDVLKRIDCQGCKIDGVAVTEETVWSDIRKVWVDVGLALLTCARQRFDCDMFNQRIEALTPFSDDDSDFAHRIHHERCLWAIYSMGFEDLEDLLKDWRTENCDPFWMLRKSAILYELNRTTDAVELFDQALLDIRRMSNDDRSLAGPSREGWALFLAWALEWRRWMDRDGEDLPSDVPFRRRWRELASLNCDALSEKDQYVNEMKSRAKESDAPAFELGERTRPGIVISNEKYNRWVSARRAIRLSEVAALPNSVSGIAKPAIEELSISEPDLALRLVIRAVDYDGDPVLKRAFSRSNVARLPIDKIETLLEMCKRAVEYAYPRMFKAGKYPRNVFWIERMRVSLEVLSRLVLRLGQDGVEKVFDQALKHYRDPQVIQEPWLMEPVGNLLNRSWEALPKERRKDRVLDLLGAPILGLDDFTSDWEQSPKPEELLDVDFPPPDRTYDNEFRWRETVKLILRGLLAGGVARKRASRRLASVAIWNRLDPTEVTAISDALWGEQQTAVDDLPGETELFDWVFLLLPEPKPGLAEQTFRRKWLLVNSLSQENRPSLDEVLWQVGNAIASLRTHGYSFTFSDDEQAYLTEVVGQWSTKPVPPVFHLSMVAEDSSATRQAVAGLRTVLSEVKFREDTAEKLYNKVLELNAANIPAFGLSAGLVKAMPHRLDDIAHLMRTGLASADDALAESAAAGLHHWLMVSAEVESQIRTPPDDLVGEIGVIIAARRKETLALALRTAKWVFDEGNDAHKQAISRLTLQGLGYLFEELRYDREHDADLEDEIPLLRWRSAELAVSMSRSGYGDDPNVARWLAIAEEDPMPEVRSVEDTPYSRGHDNKELDGQDDDGDGSDTE